MHWLIHVIYFVLGAIIGTCSLLGFMRWKLRRVLGGFNPETLAKLMEAPRAATGGHRFKTPADCTHSTEFDGSCPVCDGGLSVCLVCGAAEGELPRECPGRTMTREELDGVLDGRLDYVDGTWRTK